MVVTNKGRMTPDDARVVITGRGLVSPFGRAVDGFERAILDGACAVGDFQDLDDGIAFKNGAPIRGFDPSDALDRKNLQSMDLFSQFAACAAVDAFREAGFGVDGEDDGFDRSRLGVVIGSAGGGLHTFESQYKRLYAEGRRKVMPMTVPMIMGSAPSSHVARVCGARGPVFSVTSACASSNHAFHSALSMLRDGLADVVVCGGTDANFAHGNLKAWEALHVVAADVCRPFSAERTGLSLGEGAGVFVFERRDHALARGAVPLAEVMSVGMSSDAGNLVAPDAAGMQAAMARALESAGASVDDVDYVNAHGTGTKANDKIEAEAIRALLGARADAVPVSSTKSQVGHGLGASGALELMAVIAGMKAGKVPPTVNFETPDPECPVNVIANRAAPADIRLALSNSFAFGGLNASLLIRAA